MRIIGKNDKTYILLNGIVSSGNIKLSDNVEIQAADTSHLDLNTAISACSHPDDIAVIAAYIPRISSQLQITAKNPKELAATAWNSAWDVLLLSAIFGVEIGFNIQSDTKSNEISSGSLLSATNLKMNGISNEQPYKLTDEDEKWIGSHFCSAQQMLENDSFQLAIHCLASYRWHSLPRAKLAVLWAGIEGLFSVRSEVSFRISLYISCLLYPDNQDEKKECFEQMKKLYNVRSGAVHGSPVKKDMELASKQSAEILRILVIHIIESKTLPDVHNLPF